MVPPNPAFTNEWDPSLKEVVMVVFGAQAHDGSLAFDALDPIQGFLAVKVEHPPINPPLDRLETLTAIRDYTEGVAVLSPMSTPIKEHGYWGSMRDRIPLNQNDPMKGNKWRPDHLTDSPEVCGRVVVPPVPNLGLIRSGQDWSRLPPNEAKLWFNTLEPTFKRGMNHIMHSGHEIGCFDLRLVDHIDDDLEKLPKSFGLMYWDDIGSAEHWAEFQPTHKAIFDGFFKYCKQLDMNTALRLHHEIYVLDEDQQSFEYMRCHGRTGMLTSLVKK